MWARLPLKDREKNVSVAGSWGIRKISKARATAALGLVIYAIAMTGEACGAWVTGGNCGTISPEGIIFPCLFDNICQNPE